MEYTVEKGLRAHSENIIIIHLCNTLGCIEKSGGNFQKGTYICGIICRPFDCHCGVVRKLSDSVF